MGNNNARLPFCCRGRHSLEELFNNDKEDKNDCGVFYDYAADQSEVDIERGAIKSALKHSDKGFSLPCVGGAED